MNKRKIISVLLLISLSVSIAACSSGSSTGRGRHKNHEQSKPELRGTKETGPVIYPDPTVTSEPEPDDGIYDLDMFITLPGNEKADDNDIKELIAEKTGVRVNESYLTGISSEEAIDMLIASGELPDLIYCTDSISRLYENGELIAWDPYLEIYPNIKEMFTDKEWDRFREDDGHIYRVDIFDAYHGKDTTPVHNGFAFWIQVRVLEWAGYPEIETLDEYFDLLEAFYKANPKLPDGTEVIPYTCITESWRSYSLDLAPMFLDGYPNNNCANVTADPATGHPVVTDYNMTDTARAYFGKLNEEYGKGMIDPDFSVQTYDEYIYKLMTGRVLGMCDMYWDFGYSISDSFSMSMIKSSDGNTYTLSELGCDYVPLGLVAEKGMVQKYHTYCEMTSSDSGLAVTVSCIDPDIAFRFLNDTLSQEIHDLRFWGIDGLDYYIDQAGMYYRTDEMRFNWNDYSYKYSHTCEYSYLPQWRGLNSDGINCMMPGDQPSEFQAGLSKPVINCFDAYKVNNYVEMLGSVYNKPDPWYPLFTWSNALSTDTHYGTVFYQIDELKHEWLPKLVLSSNFDSDWNSYMTAYEQCDPQAFIDAAQLEAEARFNS